MAVTNKGTSWEIKKSLWIIFSFIYLLNGVGILYAGLKVKVKKWTNYGIIYTTVSWITFILVGSTGNVKSLAVITNIALGIFLVSGFVAVIHSFLIRKEYLMRAEILEDKKVDKIEMGTLRSKFIDEYGLKEDIKAKSASFKSESTK